MIEVAEALRVALEHHQAGRLEAAEQIYRQVLEVQPDQPDAVHLVGVIAHQVGNQQEALARIARAVQLRPNDAAFHNSLAAAQLAADQPNEAIESCRRALTIEPEFAEAANNLGLALSAVGRHGQALAVLETAVATNPRNADLRSTLAMVLRRLGRLDQAEWEARAALQIDPHSAEACNVLGMAAQDRQDASRAADYFRRAVEADPRHAHAYANLGAALLEIGQPESAIEACRKALQLDPYLADAHNNLGIAHRECGQIDQAIACFERALRCRPEYAEVRCNLAGALKAGGQFDEAINQYHRVIEARPQYMPAYHNLAALLSQRAEVEGVCKILRRAMVAEPEQPLWRLRIAAVRPAVVQSCDEMARYRRQLWQSIRNLREQNFRAAPATLAAMACEPPFSLQFDPVDLRSLKQAYAETFSDCFANWEPLPAKGKPRLGVVITDRHERTFLRSLAGIVEKLANDEFQVVLIGSHPGLRYIQRQIASDVIEFLAVSGKLDKVAATIRQARLDVLYYREIGTDATNYFLPMFRLAPVQCTSFGIQLTSGIPQVDYYISSGLIEPREAQQHYTERLLLASTLLPLRQRERLNNPKPNQQAYGVPASGHLYACAHQLGKFHPDFDRLLAEILVRDPNGYVAIVEDRYRLEANRLKQRMRRTMSDVYNRLLFLPYQDHQGYLALLAVSDVLLDPPYFGGMNTSYDGFSLNKPIVTMPSPFHRGRHTLGCYRKMGNPELTRLLVAPDEQAYAEMAVRLATEPDARRHVEEALAAATPSLFGDRTTVDEHRRIFADLVDIARRGGSS